MKKILGVLVTRKMTKLLLFGRKDFHRLGLELDVAFLGKECIGRSTHDAG